MITFEKNDIRFTLRVAGIALDRGRVLLHRAEHEDFWSLPGGRVEMGEAARDALVREMQEELGVAARVVRLLWVVENFFSYFGTRSHELGLYFLMELPEHLRAYRTTETFVGHEVGIRLIFEWHPVESLGSVPVKPSFLETSLANLPEEIVHVIHRDVT